MIKSDVEYNTKVQNLRNCDFSSIRVLAYEELKKFPKEQINKWIQETDRGKGIIKNHYQLCAYMYRYGPMHQEKLLFSFNHIDDDLLKTDFEIIDWGCGQAIATICLLDYLKQKGGHSSIKKITLIDPSDVALSRAFIHVNSIVSENIQIIKHAKFFESLNTQDIQAESPRNVIHLFSNVLDIDKVNLKYLSELIISSNDSDNHIVCISPNWNEKVSHRLNSFIDMFKGKTTILYRTINRNYIYAGGKETIKNISFIGFTFTFNKNLKTPYKSNPLINTQEQNSFFKRLITILFFSFIVILILNPVFVQVNSTSNEPIVELVDTSSIKKEKLEQNTGLINLTYIEMSVLEIIQSGVGANTKKEKFIKKQLLADYNIKLKKSQIEKILEKLNNLDLIE